MTTDLTPGGDGSAVHPLRRNVRSPGAWKYLANYALLAVCAAALAPQLARGVEWRQVGLPVLLLAVAVGNLAWMRGGERKPVVAGPEIGPS